MRNVERERCDLNTMFIGAKFRNNYIHIPPMRQNAVSIVKGDSEINE